MSAPPLIAQRDRSDSENRPSAFSFSRTWTDAGRSNNNTTGFGRTLTEALGLNYKAEDQWSKKLVDEYSKVADKGPEGDLPAPDGFANDTVFWKLIAICAVFGVILGLLGGLFMTCADYIPKQWHNNNFSNTGDGDFYGGAPYFILITGGAGLAVGIIRFMTTYPTNVPGLFKEIGDLHVDPTYTPVTVILSAISLAGGASLGPEQALGNLGGGMATYFSENLMEFEKVDQQLLVLCAMSAAFGGLFPTPVLGVLMLFELGQPPKPYMESIMCLSVAGVVSFVIYYRICLGLGLDHINTVYNLTAAWAYGEQNCAVAVAIGIVSGAICLTSLVTIGICKQVFGRLGDRLDALVPKVPRLKEIINPLLGGLVVGTLSYVCPLTIGDGNQVLPAIIQFSYPDATGAQFSTHLLTTSVFAKMLALGISMNCGFVGGFVFPIITIGAMSGAVCARFYTFLPYGQCIASFMVAVPAGICPMPFTLTLIPIFIFYFGLYQTVPIFISVLVSYLMVCGSGVFKALTDRAAKKPAAEGSDEAATNPETFASSQYQKKPTKEAPPANQDITEI